MIECKLVSSNTQTAFGPLCLLGHYLGQEDVLEPLSSVEIARRASSTPQQKLIDALMGILSGCRALYEIDVRVRPDAPLQRAFGRDRCADQSTIQRTLGAFTQENVAQLRGAVEAIGRRYSAVFCHDFEREMLVVEVDLTGLRASRRSEGSTKGYFSGERNATGRQLLRVIAPQYKEILFEKLYPGNTTSCEVLKESIRELERILRLAEDRQKRGRTLVRLEGGFGTDANLNWLMWRGYEFVAKGYGGKRAEKLARSVPEDGWMEGPTKSQKLGVPASPHRYARKSKTLLRRWVDQKGKPHQDYLVTSLFWLDARDSQALRRTWRDGGGHKGRQAGPGDREEEEELPRARGFGAIGSALSQPHRVLQAVVFGRDEGRETGGGEAGKGGIGDGCGGEGRKDEREGPIEVTAPSPVGEGRCSGHQGASPSKWNAYYLASKLGVSTAPAAPCQHASG